MMLNAGAARRDSVKGAVAARGSGGVRLFPGSLIRCAKLFPDPGTGATVGQLLSRLLFASLDSEWGVEAGPGDADTRIEKAS